MRTASLFYKKFGMRTHINNQKTTISLSTQQFAIVKTAALEKLLIAFLRKKSVLKD